MEKSGHFALGLFEAKQTIPEPLIAPYIKLNPGGLINKRINLLEHNREEKLHDLEKTFLATNTKTTNIGD